MVRAMQEGREPDATAGKQAALRSLHNNYFTLPVVFTMISIHYPATYGRSWNWLILLALGVIGAGTRHYFNLHHKGKQSAWILPAAALGMIVLVFVTRPTTVPGSTSGLSQFAEVRVIVAQRCAPCHSSRPTNPQFNAAPQGIMLDTPEQMQAQAPRIMTVAVDAQTMPLANATGMTEEERRVVGSWIRSGAQLR